MKILVSIDHSAASDQVIDSVTHSHWPDGSQFKIVHVLRSLEELGTSSNTSSSEWLNSLSTAQEQLKKSANQLLEGFIDKLKQQFPKCEFSSQVLEKGKTPVYSTILNVANEWVPDLIVIGSHGKQGLSRLLLGSVSFSILCESRFSVRIIKQSEFTSADNTFNVLIPLDHTRDFEDVLSQIKIRTWHPSTRFRLLTVFPNPLSRGPIPVSGSAALDSLKEETNVFKEVSSSLSNRAESLARELGGTYEVDSMAVKGDAREKIIEQAYTWPANLIVMGSYTQTILARFFLGSISSAVTLASPCSVEILRLDPSHHHS